MPTTDHETARSAPAQAASDVQASAAQGASSVAETVKGEAGNVAESATEHGKEVLGRAKDALHDEARERTAELAGSMQRLGDELQALAEGRPQEAGPIADYTSQAAARVHEIAGRVQERGFDSMVDDVAEFGRRRPGMFLAAAGAAGFAVGRMVRANRANGANGGSASMGSSRSTYRTPGATTPGPVTPASPPYGAGTMPPASIPSAAGGLP